MRYLATYLAAAVSCAATLHALGWPYSVTEGALVCAGVALAGPVGILVVRALLPEIADWHLRRARVLFERRSQIDGLWPLAIAAFFALALLEVAHDGLAELLS